MQSSTFLKSAISVLLLTASVLATPWLGLSYKTEPYKNGIALRVRGIHPNSGAIGRDLRVGDLIVNMNGKSLSDMGTVREETVGATVGKKILLGIERDGKNRSLKIAFTERPDDISSLMGSSIGSKSAEFSKNFYRNADKLKKNPKLTLIDFWATWCGPCRKTLPILGRLYQKLEREGLEVIGVSDEGEKVLDDFYRQFPSPYPLYRDAAQSLWRRYGISAVPTLMLVDADGYIQKVWPGVPDERALETAVREALNN